MGIQWRRPLWVWVLTVAILGSAMYGVWRAGRFVCRVIDSPCWFVPGPEPSRPFPDAAALAAALEDGGVACKNPELTHDRFTFQQIACGGMPDKAYDYLLVVFERAERSDWLRRDSSGCNGMVVFGDNWHVALAEPYDVREVVDAIGGRVVGVETSEDCYD